MGDSATSAIGFSTREDQIQRIRSQVDSNKDGQIDVSELDSTKLESARSAIQGYKLPGATGAPGATGTAITDNSTAPDVARAFNTGVGVVSNRPITPSPTGTSGATGASGASGATEMNIGDASNSQRLRAAGLTEGQLYNSQNIFVHLGQKNGQDQYGFYSKGFGEGDERTGVVTVGADGQISSSLGAGWSAASGAQKTQLEEAFTAREKLVKEKFDGKFEDYKEFETARAQVDDLLARGDITSEERTSLTSLKTDMDSHLSDPSQTNPTQILSSAETLLGQHSKTLQEIRQAEAAGKVADSTDISSEANLNEALKNKTNEVNKLTDAEKTAYAEALEKFNKNLASLGNSPHPTAESFRKAGEYFKKENLPQDKQTLGELKWQNARFERMKNESGFLPTPSTPTPPATPAQPSTPAPADTTIPSSTPATSSTPTPTEPTAVNPPLTAAEMASQLGTKFFEQELLNALRGFPDEELPEKKDPTGESGFDNFNSLFNSLQISSNNDSNELIISQGDNHFLYNRNSQTARSLTPVTDYQDAFYDPSEPSTLLLRKDSQFTKEKMSIDETISDQTHQINGKTYALKNGIWTLIGF